jgi:hypothetical protein
VKKIALFLFVMCSYSYGSEQLSIGGYMPGSFNDRTNVLVLSFQEHIDVNLIASLKRRYPYTNSIIINNLQGDKCLDYALAYAIINAFPHLREIEILKANVRWKKTVQLLEAWQREVPGRILNFTYKLLEEKMPPLEVNWQFEE